MVCLALVSLAAAVVAPVAVATSTSPGDVDVTFGVGGSISVPAGSLRGVTADPTGALLVSTADVAANPPTVSITRTAPDGRLDTDYGTAGTATAARPGFGHPEDLSVTVDDLGRVVQASVEESSGDLVLVLRRFLANGSADPSFGVGGSTEPVVFPSTIHDVATVGDVVSSPSGDLFVAAVSSLVDDEAATVRHAAGIIRFDGGGHQVGYVVVSQAVEARDLGFPLDRLAIDGSGRLYHASGRAGHVEVRRYSPALVPDAAFGSGGVTTLGRPGTPDTDVATSDVVVRPTAAGAYVAADFARRGGVVASPRNVGVEPSAGLVSAGAGLWRLGSAGLPDAAFSGSGFVPLGAGGVVDVVANTDGGVVVVDRGTDARAGRIRRFDAAGSASRGFGAGGSVPTVGLEPAGNVAVVGRRLVLGGSTAAGAVVRAYVLDVPSPPAAPAAPGVLGRGAGAVTVTWDAPVSDLPVTDYVVTAWSEGAAAAVATSAVRAVDVGGLDPTRSYVFTVAARSAAGRGPDSAPSRPVVPAAADGGGGSVFVPTAACRVLDTRITGARIGRQRRAVQVRGTDRIGEQGGRPGGCQIPAGATAVVAALSAVDPSGRGFLRVGAGAATAPTTTLVTYSDSSVTNVVPLSLGSGSFDLGLEAPEAATHVVIDVSGYFVARTAVSAGEGSVFVPMARCRVFDDRVNGAPIGPGTVRAVAVSGDVAAQGGNAAGCGVPAAASAVEVAVSSVAPSSGGFARVGASGSASRATVLNVAAGRSAAASATVPLGPTALGGPGIDVAVTGVRSSWVLDITGYYLPRSVAAPAGATVYHPVTPCRLADTRRAGGPVGAGAVVTVGVVGSGPAFVAQGGSAAGCGVPVGAVAASLVVSAADAVGNGETRLAASGVPITGGTLVHFRRGTSASGAGTVVLGAGSVDVRTVGGPTNQVVEVEGWFGPG